MSTVYYGAVMFHIEDLFATLLVLFIAALPLLFLGVFIYKLIKRRMEDQKELRIKQTVHIQQQLDAINARLTELTELVREKK